MSKKATLELVIEGKVENTLTLPTNSLAESKNVCN